MKQFKHVHLVFVLEKGILLLYLFIVSLLSNFKLYYLTPSMLTINLIIMHMFYESMYRMYILQIIINNHHNNNNK